MSSSIKYGFRKHQERGVVFIMTIMMMLIVTILILTMMQSLLLYIRMSNQFMVTHQTLYHLESIAKQHTGALNENCLTRENNPNRLIEWVQKNRGCSVSDEIDQYRYVISDLGVLSCLVIPIGKFNYSSHHWLITIKSLQHQAILQLRIAKPQLITSCDLKSTRRISRGNLSWRYLAHVF